MIPLRKPRFVVNAVTRRINRVPSPALALSVPWITIMLASMAPVLPFIASAPLMPPLGLMMLIAWRLIRPGLLPVWAGLPLGLFDDIFGGQPFGSAILLWSLTMIALDVIDTRFPWRSFLHDWGIGVGMILANLIFALGLANAGGGSTVIFSIIPQFLIAAALMPMLCRLVAAFDRFRLLPFVELD